MGDIGGQAGKKDCAGAASDGQVNMGCACPGIAAPEHALQQGAKRRPLSG
jgi:hypothetical protein